MSINNNELYGFSAKLYGETTFLDYDENSILSYTQKILKDNILHLTAQNNYSKSRINLKKFIND